MPFSGPTHLQLLACFAFMNTLFKFVAVNEGILVSHRETAICLGSRNWLDLKGGVAARDVRRTVCTVHTVWHTGYGTRTVSNLGVQSTDRSYGRDTITHLVGSYHL